MAPVTFHWLTGIVRAAGICLALLLPAHGEAARLSDTHKGRQVLVDYLVGLARHTQWPDTAFSDNSDPLVICVLGSDPFGGLLEKKAGSMRVGTRTLVVRQLGGDPAAATDGCHQLFVAVSQQPAIKEILNRLDNLTVLTVSDMEGFAAAGGMIGFVGSGNRVAMQINRTKLLASGLTVAPALLRLSR